MFSNAQRFISFSLIAPLPELKDILYVFPVLDRDSDHMCVCVRVCGIQQGCVMQSKRTGNNT